MSKSSKTHYELAVRYNPDEHQHEVHTTLGISFVHRLCAKTSISVEDACFLALAHEAGHVELNQRCVNGGIDPADSHNQLSVIGITLSGGFSKHLVAECHKETAIEAYCDARLAEAVHKYFPNMASTLIKAVAEIRKEESALPQRFGDDYRTALIFEAIADSGVPMSPQDAATFAFENSKSVMSSAGNIWLAAKRPLLTSLPAAIEGLQNKLRELRVNDKRNKPPQNKP